MTVLVCQAIRDQRTVRFYYHGGTREVEPYVHGYSRDGNELLRGYQLFGHSRSGERFGWKTFRLDEIRAFTVSDRSFTQRDDYDPDDPGMSSVHCRVQAVQRTTP